MKIQNFKKPYIDESGKRIPKLLFDGDKDLCFARRGNGDPAIKIKGLGPESCYKIIKNFHYYWVGINPKFTRKIKAMIHLWRWLNKKNKYKHE